MRQCDTDCAVKSTECVLLCSEHSSALGKIQCSGYYLQGINNKCSETHTISKAIDKAAAQDGLSDNIIIIIITNNIIREDLLYYKCIRH